MVLSHRSVASACTAGDTPWAENTTVAPSGTSSSSSTKIAPRRLQILHHMPVVHDLLADVDRSPVRSSAFSTVITARSTPAQYPRGAATTTRFSARFSDITR